MEYHERHDYEGLQAVGGTSHSTAPQVAAPRDSHLREKLSPDPAMSAYPQSSVYTTPATVAGKERRICGLRRTTIFLILSNIVLAIALVAVAVGVSISGDRRVIDAESSCKSQASNPSSGGSGGSSSSSSSSNNGTSSTNNSNPQVCFATRTKPQFAGGVTSVDCPGSSSTEYTVPGTNLTFVRACNTDFPGHDMGRFPVGSMMDCMALCAQLYLYQTSSAGPCRGVSWVYGDGLQGDGVGFCFPKSATQVPGQARNGSESAALKL